jgi:uncharacterized protein (TIGR04255 family)
LVEDESPLPAYPKLAKPPIREAIIEVRVRLGRRFEPAAFTRDEQIISEFSEVKKGKYQLLPFFEADGEGSISQASEPEEAHGFRLSSRDKRRILNLMGDQLSHHRLYLDETYEGWDRLKEAFERIWGIYRRTIQPAYVTGVRLRYINSMDFDLPIEMNDLTSAPPGMPQDFKDALVTGFLQKVAFNLPEAGQWAQVTQSTELGPERAQFALVLDISCAAALNLKVDDPGFWEAIEGLRREKNRLFFSWISPTMLERLK